MKSTTRTAALVALVVAPALATAQGGATPAAPQSVYRSAFEGYRSFADEPVRSWRDTNDTVGRIGGWRAYAREARSGDARPAAGTNASPAASASGAHPNHHAPVKP